MTRSLRLRQRQVATSNSLSLFEYFARIPRQGRPVIRSPRSARSEGGMLGRAGLAGGLVLIAPILAACSGSATPVAAEKPAATGQVATPTSTQSERRALLIGVTDFIDPGMRARNLEGPVNDVELFKTLLM